MLIRLWLFLLGFVVCPFYEDSKSSDLKKP